MNSKSHYKIHKIPKTSGGTRTIYNPSQLLRVYQHKILHTILNKITLPDYVWAFEVGKGIPDMVNSHVGKAVVISMDLKNYFPSIKTRHILNAVSSMTDISGSASVTLTELCTYKFFLPQGALTSPKISNMVTINTFGQAVHSFCQSKGLSLTIYADDITVSSNEKMSWEDINSVIANISKLVQDQGFLVNTSKTKIMFANRRQWVCGVVVNSRKNVIRKERLRLRAIVHNIQVNGLEEEAKKNDVEPDSFLRSIKGMLEWFRRLNPIVGGRLLHKLNSSIAA